MVRWIHIRLQGKLFLSHLLVSLMSVFIFFIVVTAISRHLIADQMHQGIGSGMMGPGQGPFMNSTLEQSILQTMAIALRIAGIAGIAIAFILSAIIARHLAQPINAIAHITKRIEQGHYGERVAAPVQDRDDEVGNLATSINLMATALENTEQRRQELIGDVAHELRTPLTTIQGSLEGMLDGVVQPTSERLAQLVDEAGRMRRLVDDLRELSRAEAHQVSIHLTSCNVATLIEAATNRMQEPIEEKGLHLQTDIAADLPSIQADPDRAVQIITNLLTNAMLYTSAPGTITIRARPTGKFIQIAVIDTGMGLSPEHLNRIFERFYRADKSRARALGGNGIGLTIARALAETMHGFLQASSEGPGKGAEFTLSLPIQASLT
jgi:signal transduction histidine kinase